MSNNDFPRWPKINLRRPWYRPDPPQTQTPFVRLSNHPHARNASFEERLTADDRLFLQAVGITI